MPGYDPAYDPVPVQPLGCTDHDFRAGGHRVVTWSFMYISLCLKSLGPQTIDSHLGLSWPLDLYAGDAHLCFLVSTSEGDLCSTTSMSLSSTPMRLARGM